MIWARTAPDLGIFAPRSRGSFDAVLDVIEQVSQSRSRTVVGITGPPGAGKSHLAAALDHTLSAPIVAMDGFHLANAELRRLGRTARKGAPDTFDADGFVRLLSAIKRGKRVAAPAFDRQLDEPAPDAVVIEPDEPVVLVEGNYLLLADDPWHHVSESLDLALYVDAPAAVRRSRLLDRQLRRFGDEAVARRWVEEVDEPNARLVEASRHGAGLVVVVDGTMTRCGLP